MSNIKKAIDFLKTRTIVTEKKNMSLIKSQAEVIPTSTVIAVLEMIEAKQLDKFLINIKKTGIPIK